MRVKLTLLGLLTFVIGYGQVKMIGGKTTTTINQSFTVTKNYGAFEGVRQNNFIKNNTFKDGLLYWEDNYVALNGNMSLITDYSRIGDKAMQFIATGATASTNNLYLYLILPDGITTNDTVIFSFIYKKSSSSNYTARYIFCNSSRASIGSVTDKSLTGAADTWLDSDDLTKPVPATAYSLRIILRDIPQNDTVFITGIQAYKKNTDVIDDWYEQTRYRIFDAQVLYVDGINGDDDYFGARTQPFATIGKALELSRGIPYTKIIVQEGDYREALQWEYHYNENVEIMADQNAEVRLMGSDSVVGWTKRGGYTNIYKAPLVDITLLNYVDKTSTLVTDQVIFEDGNVSKTIDSTFALQRGLTSRLPYTEIYGKALDTDLATTLTALDGTPGYFYYSATLDTVFIHTTDSDNPAANGFTYEYSVRKIFNGLPTSYNVNLKLINIKSYFSKTYGFDFTGFGIVERYYCTVLGAFSSGIYEGANKAISYNDESGGNSVDGIAAEINHLTGYTDQDQRSAVCFAVYYDPWIHDNGDDGLSHHRRGEVSIYGGLAEYNGDCGFFSAYGANMRGYNLIARKNGQFAANVGAGFVCQGAADGGRSYAIANFFNCVSIQNNYGFNLGTPNEMNLYGCFSKYNTTAEFINASTNKLRLINCYATTSGTLKTGTMYIQNDTLVE